MATFDPSRAALVDGSGEAPVWRGNLPINARNQIAYHELVNTLGLDVGDSLIDVSLIDNVEGSERAQWLVEMAAFGIDVDSEFPSGPNVPPQWNQSSWNPGRLLGDCVRQVGGTPPGHIVWWPIEGGTTPDVLGPDPRSYNFVGLIEYLGILRNRRGSIVYFHCMNGSDRTGAVVAGYAMRWMGASLAKAVVLANRVAAAGQMSHPYSQLVETYAKWISENPPT
jgi:hypothetical protein